MPTVIAPQLFVWSLTLENGSTANVLASSLASALGGTLPSPAVGATRGPAFGTSDMAPAVLTSLVPPAAQLGTASFTLHVHGTGFRQDSTIHWNGSPEPTTFVSPTELTTGVNMTTANVAVGIPIAVVNLPGVASNVLTFQLTPAALSRTDGSRDPRDAPQPDQYDR